MTKVRHKVFISFYHKDDQKYKDYIHKYLCEDLIDKSVSDGEYDSELADNYVKRLIREDKITDSSVIVVLVGLNTYKRKHVDWEIYAGLKESINGRSALIGILMPEIPISNNNEYSLDYLPIRLADNVKSGYAKIYAWNYAKEHFYEIVDEAFNEKTIKKDDADNSRLQMQVNLW